MREDFFSCSFTATSRVTLPRVCARGGGPTTVQLAFNPTTEEAWPVMSSLCGSRPPAAVADICRFVEGRCGGADLHEDLKPSAPYQRPRRRRRRREEEQAADACADGAE